MPSIRPSYQSLISVFQQGGLSFADAGATPAPSPSVRATAASRKRVTMFLGEWITRNGDRRGGGGGRRFAFGALYLWPRKYGLRGSFDPPRESVVIPRLSVCKEKGVRWGLC